MVNAVLWTNEGEVFGSRLFLSIEGNPRESWSLKKGGLKHTAEEESYKYAAVMYCLTRTGDTNAVIQSRNGMVIW